MKQLQRECDGIHEQMKKDEVINAARNVLIMARSSGRHILLQAEKS